MVHSSVAPPTLMFRCCCKSHSPASRLTLGAQSLAAADHRPERLPSNIVEPSRCCWRKPDSITERVSSRGAAASIIVCMWLDLAECDRAHWLADTIPGAKSTSLDSSNSLIVRHMNATLRVSGACSSNSEEGCLAADEQPERRRRHGRTPVITRT
jgi:hypothetical protein